MSEAGRVISYFLWILLAIIIIVACYVTISYLLNLAHGELWEKEYAIRNMQPLIDLIQQYLDHQAYGQKAPPAEVPTPSPTPIQIQPNPNFEYLPQKAYVQTYKPEIGIPVGQQGLTAVPQVVPVQPQQNFISSTVDSIGGIAGIMGILGAGVAYFKGHLANNKAKETMAAEVKTKEQLGELARVSFENMPNKGNEITDAPAVKLENLQEDKAEFAEKAAKA